MAAAHWSSRRRPMPGAAARVAAALARCLLRREPAGRPAGAACPCRRCRPAARGWAWRPLGHAVVAVAPLPVVLLLAAGHLALVLLMLALAAGVAVAVQVRRRHERALRRAAWRAAEQQAEQHAAQVLLAVYEAWLAQESARGHRELEHWRRTHCP